MNKKVFLVSILSLALIGLSFLLRYSLDNLPFYGTASYTTSLPKEIVLPFIFGIATLLILHFITKKIDFDEDCLFLLIFIISPAFVGLYTSLNNQVIVLILILLEVFLYLRNNYLMFIFPPLIGFFEPQFSIVHLLTFLFLWKDKTINLALLSTNLLTLLLLKNFYFSFDFSLVKLISEFGSFYGASFFALILSVYGVVTHFKEHKNSKLFVFLTILTIMIVSFKGLEIFYHLVISYFSAIALYYLYNRDWELKELKYCFIILFFVAITCSTISQTIFLSGLPPNKNFEVYAKKYLISTDVVLTTKEMGVWINYFSKSKIIEGKQIFEKGDFKEIDRFIKQNKITHIVIPSYEIGIKFREDRGFLFFLTNKEIFEKTLSHKDLQIWKVKNE